VDVDVPQGDRADAGLDDDEVDRLLGGGVARDLEAAGALPLAHDPVELVVARREAHGREEGGPVAEVGAPPRRLGAGGVEAGGLLHRDEGFSRLGVVEDDAGVGPVGDEVDVAPLEVFRKLRPCVVPVRPVVPAGRALPDEVAVALADRRDLPVRLGGDVRVRRKIGVGVAGRVWHEIGFG
jgi:hypothetical protein